MQPIDVHIHTNTNCNLKCIHCYESAAAESEKMVISSSFEVKLIQFLCNHFHADIHLEGGEIFLEEHLIQALLMLDIQTRKNITVTSNGCFRTKNADTLEALRSISCLRISVEGHTEALHKKVRNCSLQTVLDHARYYKDMGIKVVLRITLNALNMQFMFSEVIPTLMKEGFNDFQIYEMQPVGRGRASDLCITEPLDSFYHDWLLHPLKANIKVSLSERRINEIKQYQESFANIGVKTDFIGNNASIAIGADYAVRICPWDMKSDPIVVLNENNIPKLCDIIKLQEVPHKCEFCTKAVLKVCTQC